MRITLIYFCAGIVLFTCGCGCSKEPINQEETTTSNGQNLILGNWELVLTGGGFSPQQIPIPPKYPVQYEFSSNDTLYVYENYIIIDTINYYFEYRKNNLLDPKSDSTLMLKIYLLNYFNISNDSLYIDSQYIDGPLNIFFRIR